MNKRLFGAFAGWLFTAGMAAAQTAPGYGYGYPQPAPGWYGGQGVPQQGYMAQPPMRPMMPGGMPQGPAPMPPQLAPYVHRPVPYNYPAQGYPMARMPQQGYVAPQMVQTYSLQAAQNAVQAPVGAIAAQPSLGVAGAPQPEKLGTPGGKVEQLPTPGASSTPVTELPDTDCVPCEKSKKGKLFGSKKDACDDESGCSETLLSKLKHKLKKDDDCIDGHHGKHHKCDDDCVHHPWFLAGEYLLWRIRDGQLLTPLATTGPDGTLGVIGNNGVVPLIGGIRLVDFGDFNGAKVTIGRWLCPEKFGIEATAFCLEEKGEDFTAASPNGAQTISRPFFDALNGIESARVLSSPGQFQIGGLSVRDASRLWGAEFNPLCRVCNGNCVTVDFLTGFRYLDLEEGINISDSSTILPGGIGNFNGVQVGPGSTIAVRDAFNTRNQYYGGQLGLRVQAIGTCWVIDGTIKVAGGTVHQSSEIRGSSTLSGTVPAPTTVPGGLLAVSSNIGRRQADDWAVLPEASFNISLRVSDCVTLNAGYTFLYIDKVLRPGDQLTRMVNPALVPSSPNFGLGVGPQVPTPVLQHKDFTAFGLNAGIAFIF